MSTALIAGCLVVALAGLFTGAGAWPFKLMKNYQFEHWWFAGILVGLVILPWTMTFALCPNACAAISSLWRDHAGEILLANALTLAWGVANVLCGICFVRIGVALTGAILAGLGVTVGVLTPFLLKTAGMGKFSEAPDLSAPAAKWVLAGLAIILIGVVLAAAAGFGRDRVLRQNRPEGHKGFAGGLVLTVIAGVLSAGMGLSFVYSQGPVTAVMKANGAGEFAATIPVWALGIVGGVLVNLAYPAYLLTKNKSWNVFAKSRFELLLCLVLGADTMIGISLMGYGMMLMGALGASVGFGIQQAGQIMGNQGLGFISGEWRNVHGRPRTLMYTAIAVLIFAAAVMAYGLNVLAPVKTGG